MNIQTNVPNNNFPSFPGYITDITSSIIMINNYHIIFIVIFKLNWRSWRFSIVDTKFIFCYYFRLSLILQQIFGPLLVDL